MWLEDFFAGTQDGEYNLTLEFQPLGWEALMNGFELEPIVYIILYMLIGGAGGMSCFIAWCMLRATQKKLTIPRFQLYECYEFMLYWPTQGVCLASVPVMILCV